MNWVIKETQDDKYPDIKEYEILEENPDYGKSGVSYSGQYLHICATDHKQSAHLISAAPDMYEALKQMLDDFENGEIEIHHKTRTIIREALAKAEGKQNETK
jgi:hypothetical protein